jgi:pectin methylesterase-like acyl-CoA thioesterase
MPSPKEVQSPDRGTTRFARSTGKGRKRRRIHLQEKCTMRFRFNPVVAVTVVLSLLVSASAAIAANALPVVNSFAVPSGAISPVPVTAFTASDADGSIAGYLITETSTKPSANASGWNTSPWTQYATTKLGAVTLYAWAKDNAGGVSNARTAATNIVSGHAHAQSDVVGLAAALSGKASVYHDHGNLYQKKYAGVITVARSGGDFTNLDNAIASIVDASPANRYLVKVMPGTYVQSSPVRMKANVDIEGSGRSNTVISSAIPLVEWVWGNPDLLEGTIIMADNTSLANLTVENRNDQSGIAILVTSPSVRIENVTAEASGIGDTAAAPSTDYTGIWVGGDRATDVTIENVQAIAMNLTPTSSSSPRAVVLNNNGPSTISIRNSTLVGTGGNAWARGVYAPGTGLTVQIKGCVMEASNFGEGTAGGIYTGDPAGNTIVVEGTRSFAYNSFQCEAIVGAAAVTNSEARNVGCGSGNAIQWTGKVASTLIEGSYDAGRILYSWDQDFNPITYP